MKHDTFISRTIKHYNDHAEQLAVSYESLEFEDVHRQSLHLMPNSGQAVLDIGAGSGRDAAWFARRGCDVVAVEPAKDLLSVARELHKEPQITWLDESLPGLERTTNLGLAFDLVMLSAVWMHIAPNEKPRAFRKIANLLRPGGLIFMSLRHGSFIDGRESYPSVLDEIEKLPRDNGLTVLQTHKSEDLQSRAGVSWETIVIQSPDDGTDALPLLRHIILNDNKSSTYKLALLRILVRIADSAGGMARPVVEDGHDYVAIPLGLVALYWLRTYKNLVKENIPQRPADKSGKGMSFVGEAFLRLDHLSPYDLRVGATFTGDDARNLHDALVDARNTIHKQPANFIAYPNSSEPIFKTRTAGRLLKFNTFTLNEVYLSAFGELKVPARLWNSMSRFASWIEPALISEWIKLMRLYSQNQPVVPSYDHLFASLTWLDPERDTRFVRQITGRLYVSQQPVHCVWSGQRLTQSNIDIDHCFPFAAWPCGDLWNLMLANKTINQHQKRDKLVTARSLEAARERILEWWHIAFLAESENNMGQRFVSEAAASLPMKSVGEVNDVPQSIFTGLTVKRASLKSNLLFADWDC